MEINEDRLPLQPSCIIHLGDVFTSCIYSPWGCIHLLYLFTTGLSMPVNQRMVTACRHARAGGGCRRGGIGFDGEAARGLARGSACRW
jgi:hypothetical protein